MLTRNEEEKASDVQAAEAPLHQSVQDTLVVRAAGTRKAEVGIATALNPVHTSSMGGRQEEPCLVRDPVAHPVAPRRPERAVKRTYHLATEESFKGQPAVGVITKVRPVAHENRPEGESHRAVVEPIEPGTEFRRRECFAKMEHRLPRLVLSPSQRHAEREALASKPASKNCAPDEVKRKQP